MEKLAACDKESSSRYCKGCKTYHEVEAFGFKDTAKTRPSTTCRAYEAANRKRQRQEEKDAEPNKRHTPDPHIVMPAAPAAILSQHNHGNTVNSIQQTPEPTEDSAKSEARTSLDGLDFAYWEARYGRRLTEVEKLEIVGNLSAFFTVLESEIKE